MGPPPLSTKAENDTRNIHSKFHDKLPAKSTASQNLLCGKRGPFFESSSESGRKQAALTSSLVAHDCGYPLSRYTCRATRVAADFLDSIAFCRCGTGVALHPLKILVSHLPPPLCREVSHRNLGLKRCRATRGCRSYSCGCVQL